MNRRNQLLNAWDCRGELPDDQQFSADSREKVATIFLHIAKSHDAGHPDSGLKASLKTWTGDLVKLGSSEELPLPAFCAELRSCQISLLELLLTGYLEKVADTAMASALADTLHSSEQLIESCAQRLRAVYAERDESAQEKKGKSKSLQHEIRTPLQGALLTTELMLEDSQQGDKVQSEDILAVRRSIETAVQILNDFAEQPGRT